MVQQTEEFEIGQRVYVAINDTRREWGKVHEFSPIGIFVQLDSKEIFLICDCDMMSEARYKRAIKTI